MKNYLLSILFLMLTTLSITAQDSQVEFYVDAPDTVAVGEGFEITFTLKNSKGNFVEPDWGSIQKSPYGASRQQSTSVINGVVSSEYSWRYPVIINQEGTFTINPASVITDEKTLKTDWVKVVAVEGYEMPRKKQPSFFGDFWGTPQEEAVPEQKKSQPKKDGTKKKKKPKRKKKTYRI